MADQFMYAMIFIGSAVVLFAILFGGIAIYGAIQEKNEYEAKIAQRIKVIRQQQLTREKENAVKAAKESG
jgi:hypothetical protein